MVSHTKEQVVALVEKYIQKGLKLYVYRQGNVGIYVQEGIGEYTIIVADSAFTNNEKFLSLGGYFRLAIVVRVFLNILKASCIKLIFVFLNYPNYHK